MYFAAVLALVSSMVVGTYLLGGRSRNRTNILRTSRASSRRVRRVRLSADFYLFAMFFVIVDLESVFVYTWAIAVKELGWPGYLSMSVFVTSLAAALVYLWRAGALDSKK